MEVQRPAGGWRTQSRDTCTAPLSEYLDLSSRVIPRSVGNIGLHTHQGASQDSHLRDWPGGGGVSLNRYPVGSCLPSAQKLSLGPADLLRIFLRAVGESRLTNDIARGSTSSAFVCHSPLRFEPCRALSSSASVSTSTQDGFNSQLPHPSFTRQLLGPQTGRNSIPSSSLLHCIIEQIISRAQSRAAFSSESSHGEYLD